jgi:hypothetical protein
MKTDLKKRYHFANALKVSKIDYARVRRYGYKISEKLWSKCSIGGARNIGN